MANEWPVRRTAADLVKPSRTARKMATTKVRRDRTKAETRSKLDAAKRDGYRCRFPLCECKKHGIALHGSHQAHRGIGGNPAGDRSQPHGILTLCFHRHMDGAISLHHGTLRATPLSARECDGPMIWLADRETLARHGLRCPGQGAWVEIARERAVRALEPLKVWQMTVLERLAGMVL